MVNFEDPSPHGSTGPINTAQAHQIVATSNLNLNSIVDDSGLNSLVDGASKNSSFRDGASKFSIWQTFKNFDIAELSKFQPPAELTSPRGAFKSPRTASPRGPAGASPGRRGSGPPEPPEPSRPSAVDRLLTQVRALKAHEALMNLMSFSATVQKL